MLDTIPKDALVERPVGSILELPVSEAPLAPAIDTLPGGDRNNPPVYIYRRLRGGLIQYLHSTGDWLPTTQNPSGAFTGIYPSRESAWTVFMQYFAKP